MWRKSPYLNNNSWHNHASGSRCRRLCSSNSRRQNWSRHRQLVLSRNRHRDRRLSRNLNRGCFGSRCRKYRRQTHRRKCNAGVPLQQLPLSMEGCIMDRCPDCNSDDIIPWDDGYICRDCGCEFDEINQQKNEEIDF